jgi:hypothetical protein
MDFMEIKMMMMMMINSQFSQERVGWSSLLENDITWYSDAFCSSC